MTDLIEQLANYRQHFDRTIGHVESPGLSVEHAIESEPDETEVVMIDIRTSDTREDLKTRRKWLDYTGLAAAAITIAVVTVALLVRTDENAEIEVGEAPSELVAPTVTTVVATTVPVSPEMAAVLAYYDATNRGDPLAVPALLTGPKAEDYGDGTGFPEVFAVANQQATLLEPCRVAEPDLDGQVLIDCTVRYYNDWFGPAGIGTDPFVEQFTVTSDGKISAINDDQPNTSRLDPRNEFVYMRAFWAWLSPTYPEVFDEIKSADGESFPGWEIAGHDLAADMAIALQYVDEFIVQSEIYPVVPQDS